MIELKVTPTILSYKTFQQFVEEACICETDLIITNHYIYEADIEPLGLNCPVVFQEEYGFGEPTDDMLEAIHKDVPQATKRIIAVGGGTVLDISKLLSLKQCLPAHDLYDGKIEPVKDKELVLIPTTCGTGSEVTNVAVLFFPDGEKKAGLALDQLYGTEAVLIPELLETLPFNVFATTSIDALVHAIEAVLSPNASPTTRLLSYTAMGKILDSFIKMKDEKISRKDLHGEFLLASTYAGMASANAGCGAVHALSYPLGSKCHVPHGEANYAVFSGVMKAYLAIKSDGAIAELNSFMAAKLKCPEDQALVELEKGLNMLLPKKPLNGYGVKEADLDKFTDSVMNTQGRLMANNFVPLDRQQVYNIYKELF